MNSYFAFCAAALAVTLAPGPDTFLVIGNAVKNGARGGLATVAGITSGGVVPMALFAGGLAQLLVYSPAAFLVVKTLGALYLIWLGANALRGAFAPARDIDAAAAGSVQPSLRRAYWQGVLTNALNPKIALFYLAFLPQFMDPAQSVALQSVLLIGTHYAMGLAWLSLVALAAARLGGWLSRGRVRRWLDGVVGAVMLGFGIRLAFATK